MLVLFHLHPAHEPHILFLSIKLQCLSIIAYFIMPPSPILCSLIKISENIVSSVKVCVLSAVLLKVRVFLNSTPC